MKTIDITIDETGEVSVDISGFYGKGCGKVLQDFTEGEPVVRATTKPEFYQAEPAKEKQRG